MPLAFPSLSHGTVAFGFYDIETAPPRSLFISCTDFCQAVCDLECVLGTPEPISQMARTVNDLDAKI